MAQHESMNKEFKKEPKDLEEDIIVSDGLLMKVEPKLETENSEDVTVKDEPFESNLNRSLRRNNGIMASYHDTQLLIAEIQKRPILWDSSTEDYKDKNKKAEVWMEVCRSVSSEYEEKNTTEKNKLGKELKARWKSLRDSYTKDCKKLESETKSGSGAVKSRRYLFSDQLLFLRKVTENRATTDSLSSVQEAEEANEDAPQNLATAQPTARSEPTKRKKISLEERMIKFLEDNEEQKDADKDFFMSMLPSVRTLNEEQKMEFRMQVILALQNIKSGRYGHSVNPVSQPSPSTFPSVQHQYQMFPH